MQELENFSPWNAASESEIADAEKALGLTFAADYRAYLAAFGAMDAYGIEMTGIIDDEELHVVAATQSARERCPDIISSCYLIEDAHFDGILIWQDSTGGVYHSEPNQPIVKIADSLTEWLKDRCDE
jgi:hypothetical protein